MMGFRFAWPKDETVKADLGKRIAAEDFPGKEAICPLHGCVVVSRFANGVWQWVHEGGRRDRPNRAQRRM